MYYNPRDDDIDALLFSTEVHAPMQQGAHSSEFGVSQKYEDSTVSASLFKAGELSGKSFSNVVKSLVREDNRKHLIRLVQ